MSWLSDYLKSLKAARKPAPAPVVKPPVATTPAPAPQPSQPKPVAQPAPTPASVPAPPQPAPAPIPGPVISPGPAADPNRLDRSLLKSPVLDWVFARDGLGLKPGGPFFTRRQYGAMNDDSNGMGWDNRKTDNAAAMAWYSDRDLSPGMDPFSLGTDGMHIAIREFTPAQRALAYPKVQEIQRNAFWTGQLVLYGLDPAGTYVSVKLKTPGVPGEWPAAVLYSDPFLHEIDIAEVTIGGGSDCSYHRWDSDASKQIHDSKNAVMADGSPLPNPDKQFVEYGCMVTPGRLRWYREGVLTRDLAIGPVAGTFWLQIVNNAVGPVGWGGGPMAVADAVRADLIVESVKVWTV